MCKYCEMKPDDVGSKQKIAEELGIAESAVRHYCDKYEI